MNAPRQARVSLSRSKKAPDVLRNMRPGRWPLGSVIAAFVLGGLLVLWGAFVGLNWLLTGVLSVLRPPIPGPEILENLKVALTVVGGIGGIVALTVAYRRQKWLETDEAGRRDKQQALHTRYGAAVNQLGHENPTIALTGVYALANLADQWQDQRQQCVDVPCSYLRLPWDWQPPSDQPPNEHPRDSVRTTTAVRPSTTGEAEVRKIITRTIADHLRATTSQATGPPSWSNLSMDFTGATLPESNFQDCTFDAKTTWANVTFLDIAQFTGAKLTKEAEFHGAKFTGHAMFARADFRGAAWFLNAEFEKDASFSGATFQDAAGFKGAKFSGGAAFVQTRFEGAVGFGAEFSGNTLFQGANFAGGATFDGVTFPDVARFNQAVFAGKAGFGKATFCENADFSEATFQGAAEFSDATFKDDVKSTGPKLERGTRFDGSTFKGDAEFDMATFKGRARFDKATFTREAVSYQASFMGGASQEIHQFLTQEQLAQIGETETSKPED